METPLTPLEFARRARRLYGDSEAVVDENLRFSYEAFFDRCDRWSAALQSLGVRQGDRVAYIAPNTHAQLESFYAVPQIGAVLVPINYRLTPADLAYLIQHSGSRVVCGHSDYLDAIDSIRTQIPCVEHFVALEGCHPGWLDYEQAILATPPVFEQPEIDENDLLTINYTSGTTSRPKGVMITHRNALWLQNILTGLSSLKLINFYLFFSSARQRWSAVFGLVASVFKTSAQLRLENIALRHQLAVLRRSAPKRLKVTPADRIFWVWLRLLWDDWKSALMIVKAETVVAWHRKGFRLFWTWKIYRGKPGRPQVPKDIRDLIRMMSRNNPRWGAPRIHGELLKLGIEITEPTVAKYMVRHRKPPSQTWRTFLDNHVKSLVSVDFFVVPTIRFAILYVSMANY
jgi:hypothetical protein